MTRYLIILSFTVLICLATVSAPAGSPGLPKPLARDGILDLRTWHFESRGWVVLSGQWEFFWQRLLPPGGPDPASGLPDPDLVHAPGSWTHYRTDREKLPGSGFATYRLRVLLPKADTELGLKFLDMATAFKVFANGRQIYSAGVPGNSPDTTIPGYRPEVIPLEPLESGWELELIIHAANFDHWQGGMWEQILLGPAADLHRFRENRLFVEALMFGSILIMAVYHLSLYRFRPQDASSLWFSLFCFMMAVRTVTHGERYVMSLLPGLSWDLLIRSVYISFYACVPMFVLYFRSVFPNEVSRWCVRAAVALNGAAVLLTLVAPAKVFTAAMPVMQAVTLGFISYGAFAAWLAFHRRRRDAVIFLAGFLIFSLTIINDVLYTRQLIFTTHLVPFGLITFIFFQAVLISRRFSRAFFLVKKQQHTLEKEVIQRKRAEAAALVAAEQEKYALVGQVAGKLAHDFNNILGAVMGHTELSLLDCNQPGIRQSLEVILNQTRQGRVLTQNLVAFAKDQEPRQACFNINDKIQMVLSLMKKDLANIQLDLDLDPDLPGIMADPGMIEQALVNLIQNSAHAMGLTPDPLLSLKTSSGPSRIFVEISDNGCGIPMEHQKDIFAPAFTLKGIRDELGAYRTDINGTGYGMANVKKCMDKHEAGISFTSTVDGGTTFVLSFPVRADDECRTGPGIRETVVRSVRGKRILVVEDDPAISYVLKTILTSHPFSNELVHEKDGESAMALFEDDPAGTPRFDLVSLDYLLPGHLTGLDVYHHIRHRNSKIPIVFVSGNLHFIESVQEMQENDPYLDHLAKPFGNKDYTEMISRWLG